jgi:hypothetical protein
MRTADVVEEDTHADTVVPAMRHPRLWAMRFWVIRYAPPEIAGTLTMVVAGIAVAGLGAPVWLVGIAAALAEGIGFYAVAGIAVWKEQRRAFPERGRAGILIRVLGLLLFEFGPAELLDTFLVRPVAIMLGVQLLPDVVWGLIAGKVVADIAFYVLAATAFRVSEKTGVRGT